MCNNLILNFIFYTFLWYKIIYSNNFNNFDITHHTTDQTATFEKFKFSNQICHGHILSSYWLIFSHFLKSEPQIVTTSKLLGLVADTFFMVQRLLKTGLLSMFTR